MVKFSLLSRIFTSENRTDFTYSCCKTNTMFFEKDTHYNLLPSINHVQFSHQQIPNVPVAEKLLNFLQKLHFSVLFPITVFNWLVKVKPFSLRDVTGPTNLKYGHV